MKKITALFQIPILLLTDFYKIGHVFQYPKGTNLVYSNLTPRKSRIKGLNKVVFVGLQYFIKEYLISRFNKTFFEVPFEEALEYYKRRIRTSLGGDIQSYEHLKKLHKLGYLPISIKAVPEGTVVDMKVPCLTIVNTLPEFYWLPNFLETLLSDTLWQICTSATLAHQFRQTLLKYAKETVSDDMSELTFLNWQGHDFSMRGLSSLESAILSGMGHLFSFWGTDTIPAIDSLEAYYGADADKEVIGGSIPATEHSVMCMGTKEDERNTFLRLITEIYPSGYVSIVSDTWDYFKTINVLAPSLKKEIMSRDGKVVFRPDSGVPEHIVAGYRDSEVTKNSDGTYLVISGKNEGKVINELEFLGSVEILYSHFGGIVTKKGYKLLDSHVGLIYGDSITVDIAESILIRLKEKGYCSFNIVFGIGSFTYQYNTRDTFGLN